MLLISLFRITCCGTNLFFCQVQLLSERVISCTCLVVIYLLSPSAPEQACSHGPVPTRGHVAMGMRQGMQQPQMASQVNVTCTETNSEFHL